MSPRAPRVTAAPVGPTTRRVAVLGFPDCQILDVIGPLEVFSRTERWLRDHGRRRDRAYTVEILGPARRPFPASSGLLLHPAHDFAHAGRGLDTLLVAGGAGTPVACANRRLIAWIRAQARRVRRLGSVCTGAFLLAEAGLLDGRRATTHWASCARLAERYPAVRLEPDRIYVRDGAISTSGGVTAGMDLALAMVEEDHGREVALAVARELVMFLHRPGGQAQFSAVLASQLAEHAPLRELQAWILEHPEERLTVADLARRVDMSPRNFARVFAREVGVSPARFVASVRVETARRLLEETTEDLAAVCARSGLGTSESMRRAFQRAVGVAPSRYRERFHRRPPSRRGQRAAPRPISRRIS